MFFNVGSDIAESDAFILGRACDPTSVVRVDSTVAVKCHCLFDRQQIRAMACHFYHRCLCCDELVATSAKRAVAGYFQGVELFFYNHGCRIEFVANGHAVNGQVKEIIV